MNLKKGIDSAYVSLFYCSNSVMISTRARGNHKDKKPNLMLLFSGEAKNSCFSFMIDFAGNDSSETLTKEVILKRETMTNRFLSASNISTN